MTVAGELDRFRATLPGCTLVIFGDLFSQITLCVSSSRKYRQEQLDAFCILASALLDGGIARSVASLLGVPGGEVVHNAVVLQRNEVQVFVRSPFEAADVLCCVGPVGLDVDEVSDRASATFRKITELQ